jgi:exodeoxyribonuclease-3
MASFASWNVNGIRACFKSGFVSWIKTNSFDVVGLQEVRAEASQIPEEVINLNGYYKYWCPSRGRKGYSGVGILSRVEPLKVTLGMGREQFDVEGRVITAEFQDTYFVSAYFPNSQDKGARIAYKIDFCDAIQEFCQNLLKSKKSLVLCGDYNIAHQPIDLARPDENEETAGYLPAEREWISQFLESGWIDTFRDQHPTQTEAYSWWSARTRARERNIGWRIDYQVVPAEHQELILNSEIQDQVLGSDHCPVTLDFDVKI